MDFQHHLVNEVKEILQRRIQGPKLKYMAESLKPLNHPSIFLPSLLFSSVVSPAMLNRTLS